MAHPRQRLRIGREIDAWRRAGLKVAGGDPGLQPVLITAALDKLRGRLAARGRESAAAAARRLARSDAYAVDDSRLVTIVNDGALDAAAESFVRLLATLRCSPGARRRA